MSRSRTGATLALLFFSSMLLISLMYLAANAYIAHMNQTFPETVRSAAIDIAEPDDFVCLIAPPDINEPLVALGERTEDISWSAMMLSALQYEFGIHNNQNYLSYFGKSWREIHFGAVTRDGRLFHWSILNRRFEPTKENYIRYSEARRLAERCFDR